MEKKGKNRENREKEKRRVNREKTFSFVREGNGQDGILKQEVGEKWRKKLWKEENEESRRRKKVGQ